MKKVLLVVLLYSLFMIEGYAQQDPQYTQYMYNMNVVNPAYAGSRGTLSIGVLGRLQWTGLNGAPETYTANVHAPLSSKVGLGLSAIADENGPLKEQNIYADFSYTLETSDLGRLALGIKAGVTLKQVGLFSLTRVNPNDDAFNDNVNSADPNIGAGAFYYTDKFYVGFSMPNMLQVSYAEFENGQISRISENMHYFLTTGYVFDLNKSVKFKPSILVKATSGSPISMDFSTNFLFNERFELGASYRLDDSISGLVNVAVSKTLRLGFAYDHTLTNLGDFNNGSFEGILLWDIQSSDKKIKSPRFF